MEPTNGELSLRDIVGVAKKRRWLIAAVTLLTLAATMALTLIPAPDYRSDADVVVQDSAAQEALDDRFNSVSNLNRDLSNEAALAESDAVLGVLSRRTGRDLSEEVDVSFATDSDVLVFSAWSEFPQDSADLANAYAEQFINTKRAIALESLDDAIITLEERLVRSLEERLEVGRPIQEAELRLADASEGNQRSIQREIDRLSIELGPQLSRIDGRISSLSERLTRLEVEAELAGIGTARLSQQAIAPPEGSATNLVRNLTLGIAAAIALSAIAAALLEGVDTKIRSAEDIRAVTTLPILGSIPSASRRTADHLLPQIALREPDSQLGSSFHRLRMAIEFGFLAKHGESILVTSPNQSDGKTTTATNLASAFASLGTDTTLIEADLRRPRFHRIFHTNPDRGLTASLEEGHPLTNVVHQVPGAASLAIVPAGRRSTHPTLLVGSEAFGDLLDYAEKESQVLIVDAPPVLPVPDALQLSNRIDGVLLVVRAGRTKSGELAHALDSLNQAGATMIGIALVGAKASDSYYGYSYDEDTPGLSDRFANGLKLVKNLRQ